MKISKYLKHSVNPWITYHKYIVHSQATPRSVPQQYSYLCGHCCSKNVGQTNMQQLIFIPQMQSQLWELCSAQTYIAKITIQLIHEPVDLQFCLFKILHCWKFIYWKLVKKVSFKLFPCKSKKITKQLDQCVALIFQFSETNVLPDFFICDIMYRL